MTQRTTTPKPFCFVLMPFAESFDDVYAIGIKEACDSAGAYCERVDEQIFDGRMLDRIYNQIATADFIVADMTGRNANVFYEVGYAHALGTPTILLTQDAVDIPFDLKHFPHIVYANKLTVLRDELTKRVEWHVANPASDRAASQIALDVYTHNGPLRPDDSFRIDGPTPNRTDLTWQANFSLHNNSLNTYGFNALRIGLIAPSEFSKTYDNESVVTQMPDGRWMHMSTLADTLLPQAYASIKVGCSASELLLAEPTCFPSKSGVAPLSFCSQSPPAFLLSSACSLKSEHAISHSRSKWFHDRPRQQGRRTHPLTTVDTGCRNQFRQVASVSLKDCGAVRSRTRER